MQTPTEQRPLVSVVVPLHNEAARLSGLLAALQDQTYSPYEVILVDNDSTDETAAVASKHASSLTRIISERSIRNPETARNTGVQSTRGEILAFTDGDCLPDRRWLEVAVDCLRSQSADLAAGQIEFDLPGHPNAAQIYDSISFLQHSDSVRDRRVAFTCNLLITRSAFDAIGGFVTDGGWNGDSVLSRQAARLGFRLVYAQGARVRHPVRSWKGLFQKVWRIALSKGLCSGKLEGSAKAFFVEPKPHIRHLHPKRVAESLRKRFGKALPFDTASVTTVAWVMGAVGGLGFVSGWVSRSFRAAVTRMLRRGYSSDFRYDSL